jgi:hypothetical protein
MCNCGCNTCDTKKSTLILNESLAPRAILSEGLKHHIDNDKPLTNNFYTAGSRDYFDLIAEARSLYSRGILEFTNKKDIELLTETDQGYFGIYEGKKVPLDFPIELNEQRDLEDELANMEFGMDYDQLGDNEKEWVRDEMYNMNHESINENEYYVTRNLGRGQGKGLVKSIESDFEEPRVFSKEEAEKYVKQAQSGGAIPGQIVAYWVSDKDMNRVDETTIKEKIIKIVDEAKFKGKTVTLNKPTRGDSKKFKVYVNSGKKNADGSIKVKKVNFGHGGTSAKKAGQKTMKIRKSNPKARSAFRARHNCDNPGPKTKARYWSCKKW